ncbi:MAG: hypothetical protein BGO49_06280 [Planctomycetales bacterium 71-10]|nr:MAG: hypothetical protein BGO49_06280 [Planctomycetales bacterium 71-10]
MEPTPAPAPPSRPASARVRWFKRLIILATLAAVAGVVASFPIGRHYAVEGYTAAKRFAIYRLTGLGPDRSEIEADWARRRALGVARTTEVLTKFYDGAGEPMKRLFDVAGMDPTHGLVRYGRGDQSFLLSSQVFERDDAGRSYRFRPDLRSVWLRQVTLHNGPFGLFLVPDTPAHREAAAAAGAIVDEVSATTTNSWGLRGPEPDPTAPLRGVILGDSFMQGMFNPDDQTPPVHLARRLAELEGTPVSVANTGHIGYSPEQYYYSLLEYGPRMNPHFVVVSVCPNDFGSEFDILAGRPDWMDEAAYWIDRIYGWCRAKGATFLLVPVPSYPQVESRRKDGFYPGLVNNIFPGPPPGYLDPLERFLDENLRLKLEAQKAGEGYARCKLYNRQIDDDHFSPKGAEVWADAVARRLSLLMATTSGGPARTAPAASR